MKIITQKEKENARARRKIMENHENIPEFFYNMIWIFFVSSITKCDYKIEGSQLEVKKKHITIKEQYPNHFS